MAFEHLPSELVLDILSRLNSPEDLMATSVCCHRLNALVQPILYSSVKQSGRRTIPCFLRTIFEKPHLARHVKVFTGRMIPYMSHGPGELDGQFWTMNHRARVRKLLRDMKESDFEDMTETELNRWHSAVFSHDNWDATTALLLRLLPNLQKLMFTAYYNGRGVRFTSPHFLERALQQSAIQQRLYGQPQYSLAKLQTISIANCYLRTILPFLHLDSVNHLMLDKLSDADIQYETANSLDLDPTIQRLSIKGMIPSATIEKVLRRLPKLTHFRYDHKQDPLRGDSFSMIPRSIGSGLLHLIHSLEELILTNLGECWINTSSTPDNSYSKRSLGSLSNFSKLRRLEAPAAILLGKEKGIDRENYYKRHYTPAQSVELVENLPSSLHHLTIRDCTLEILKTITVLFEFMRKGEENLKGLKEVDLVFNKDTSLGSERTPWVWWDGEAARAGILLRRFRKSI